MIRRCIVTTAAIQYPSIRESLAKLMCHSLVTSNVHYQMAIRDQQVSTPGSNSITLRLLV